MKKLFTFQLSSNPSDSIKEKVSIWYWYDLTPNTDKFPFLEHTSSGEPSTVIVSSYSIISFILFYYFQFLFLASSMAFRFWWQYKISFLRNYSAESKLCSPPPYFDTFEIRMCCTISWLLLPLATLLSHRTEWSNYKVYTQQPFPKPFSFPVHPVSLSCSLS